MNKKIKFAWWWVLTLVVTITSVGETGQLIIYESDPELDATEKIMIEGAAKNEPEKAFKASEKLIERYRSVYFLKNASPGITPEQQALQLLSYRLVAAEGYFKHKISDRGIYHLEQAVLETFPYLKGFSFDVRMATVMRVVDLLGMSYWVQKRYDEAVRIFETLPDYFPEPYGRAYAVRSIGNTYFLKGDLEKARGMFEKVVTDFKDDPSSEVGLEVALARQHIEEVSKTVERHKQ